MASSNIDSQVLMKDAKGQLAAKISTESLFFSNLILLGFDPVAYGKKYNTPFSPDMFRKSNIKVRKFSRECW